MSSNEFSAFNLISNIAQLARDAPGNPDVLAEALTQLTGVHFRRATAQANEQAENAAAPSGSSEVSAAHQQDNADSQAESSHQGERDSRSMGPGEEKEDTTNEETALSNEENNLGQDNDQDNDESSLDSYHSCKSQAKDKHLHDHSSAERLPQGTVSYGVDEKDFRLAWRMVEYGRDPPSRTDGETTIEYCSCLGMYECPVDGCKFRSNPAYPKKNRKKGRAPDKAIGQGFCRQHKGTKLVHVPCEAKVRYSRTAKSTWVDHEGHHKHSLPHEKPSKASKKWVSKLAELNEEALPNQVARGTNRRPSARDIHPGLANQDRLSYEMKKAKDELDPNFTLKDLPHWEEKLGGTKFLKRAKLDGDDASIIIQYPEMEALAKLLGGTADDQVVTGREEEDEEGKEEGESAVEAAVVSAEEMNAQQPLGA
jgi:hypothetical protein